MSDLDEFMAEGVAEFLDVVGRTPFTLAGHRLQGDFNEFAGEHELMGEGGGFVGEYAATILAPLAQFSVFPQPLEKTLTGQRVQIEARTLRVDNVAVDRSTVTLRLQNADATR